MPGPPRPASAAVDAAVGETIGPTSKDSTNVHDNRKANASHG